MSGIAAGSIIHVGGRTVINRLQDAGLQDPRVPTQTVYETGNDLVVGKILTEADFRFQLTSWDVSTALMALLTGKYTTMGELLGSGDPDGTVYKWEDCEFVNVASPWKSDKGSDGGDIVAGVVVPGLMCTGLTYRLGVTDNAQMQATLSTGAYYMAQGYPLEEIAVGDGHTTAFITSEHAMVHRIGGAGSERYRHILGVLVDGIVQVPGVDYVESGGLDPDAAEGNEAHTVTVTGVPTGGSFDLIYPGQAPVTIAFDSTNVEAQGVLEGIFGAGNVVVTGGPLPGAGLVITFQGDLADTEVPVPVIDDADLAGGVTPHAHVVASFVGAGAASAVTVTFAKAPANLSVVRFMYFSTTAHAIPQADNLDTTVTPAAVRGRDITLLVGDPGGSPLELQGVQTFELTASRTGRLQREMGQYDPIGFAETGIDTNGTVTGVDRSEVYGYINQYQFPLTAVIHDPANPANIIKSIAVDDAVFQAPGENARVQQVTQFPVRWESQNGTFSEVKGQLPA